MHRYMYAHPYVVGLLNYQILEVTIESSVPADALNMKFDSNE